MHNHNRRREARVRGRNRETTYTYQGSIWRASQFYVSRRIWLRLHEDTAHPQARRPCSQSPRPRRTSKPLPSPGARSRWGLPSVVEKVPHAASWGDRAKNTLLPVPTGVVAVPRDNNVVMPPGAIAGHSRAPPPTPSDARLKSASLSRAAATLAQASFIDSVLPTLRDMVDVAAVARLGRSNTWMAGDTRRALRTTAASDSSQ